MSEKAFTPPNYKDVTNFIFNRHTGEIIATEQRWVLLNDDQNVHTHHLPVFSERPEYSHRQDIDVLTLNSAEVSKGQIKGIDIKSRRPVFEEPRSAPSKGIDPHHLTAP